MKKLAIMMMASFAATACDKSTDSFSVLGASQTFQQSSSVVLQKKIDILWVVDNSSSMTPYQTNLTNNFNSFISSFVNKGYDFHIGVTTTDAFLSLSQYQNNANLAKLKDGVGSSHSTFPVIDMNTPNITTVFKKNALQGTSGDGDERAFSSMKAALSSSLNSSFLRADSFLAIIILSDEDDFSDETRPDQSWIHGGIADHAYNDVHLDTVDSYLTYLDGITNSTATVKNYNVSAVAVVDSTCLAANLGSGSIMGQRYMDMATKTDGIKADICSPNYSSSLVAIQQKIIELSTQFFLDRTPILSSIVITVNGVSVPADGTNGWSYNSSTNSIVFHGTAVPPAGASIGVTFDPAAPTS